jgi:hypothetical protein
MSALGASDVLDALCLCTAAVQTAQARTPRHHTTSAEAALTVPSTAPHPLQPRQQTALSQASSTSVASPRAEEGPVSPLVILISFSASRQCRRYNARVTINSEHRSRRCPRKIKGCVLTAGRAISTTTSRRCTTAQQTLSHGPAAARRQGPAAARRWCVRTARTTRCMPSAPEGI